MSDYRRLVDFPLAAALALMLAQGPVVYSADSHAPTKVHDPNRVESIPIVIMADGFACNSMQLPSGFYALLFLNRSGNRSVQVSLEQMPGSSIIGPAARQVLASTVDSADARRLETVVLAPGTYRLTVPGRTTWVCSIAVHP